MLRHVTQRLTGVIAGTGLIVRSARPVCVFVARDDRIRRAADSPTESPRRSGAVGHNGDEVFLHSRSASRFPALRHGVDA